MSATRVIFKSIIPTAYFRSSTGSGRLVSCEFNSRKLHTLTSSIFRSWIDNDDDNDGTVDCINHSISARFSMDTFHVVRGRIMQLSRLSADRNFYMRRKFHDDLDVQELIHCQCQYMSSHQDMRYEARFRRCMRRCAVENRKRVNRS